MVGFHNFSTSAVKDKKNQRKVKHETPIQPTIGPVELIDRLNSN